jgi:hypothetical protein
MNDEISEILERWEKTGSITNEELATVENLRATDRRRYRSLKPVLYLMRQDVEGFVEVSGEEPSDPGSIDVRSVEEIDVTEEVMRGIETDRPRFGGRARWHQPVAAVAAIALLIAASVLGVLRITTSGSDSMKVVVQFQLSAPEAESVALVGDFNEWEPDAYVLKDPDGDGVWEIEVELEQNRVYTYNFLINETEWISDPSSKARVQDSFGGEKSVLNL